ncbi:hypothetical protein CHLNCDRAFT_134397 [Chlorella variabilis]|uniref:Uncharacterized protein n=1 Tax=Chlorella variabilis TaxID=554065 RepID=E1ZFX1_CHLVA|nr:hypothetical protein CHLNCDRAFT_134397 [Chlorella variabilis]EFN55363.1 hypothetical protein CHLNCDRAFT_134397 [Chlorella variabilis]|eukprot:XP_005847465.1 hypothetical protein CHLNCDRAFT_134397 [Chlorella variabilis]
MRAPVLGSALVALTLAAAASAEPGGAAICWGLGNAGQLGDGRSGDTAGGHFSPVPVQVLAPAGGVALQFDTLSAGGMHVCGLAAGRPFCWGSNGYGQLGVPKYYSGMSAAPVPVTTDGLGGGAAPVPRIAAGSFHSCLLDAEGAAYCFGHNYGSMLGTRIPGEDQNEASGSFEVATPSRVLSSPSFADISGGLVDYTCALTEEGAAYCWGTGEYGQLGDGRNGTGHASWEPVAVLGGHRFVALDAGSTHGVVCAVDDGGQVWCWGTGSTGELGDGRCNFEDFYEERAARCSDSAHLSNTPTAVVGNHRCQTVTAGYAMHKTGRQK